MSYKVVTNPETGMSETVPDGIGVTQEEVAHTRKKLRDMLSGNTPFHKDEFAAPAPETEPVHVPTDADGDAIGYESIYFYGYSHNS